MIHSSLITISNTCVQKVFYKIIIIIIITINIIIIIIIIIVSINNIIIYLSSSSSESISFPISFTISFPISFTISFPISFTISFPISFFGVLFRFPGPLASGPSQLSGIEGSSKDFQGVVRMCKDF